MKAKEGAGNDIFNPYNEEFMDELRGRVKEWEDNVLRSRLTEQGEIKPEYWTRHGQKEKTKAEFKSGSGEFAIKELYPPLDIAHIDPIKDIGLPGGYPYTRGKDPLGPQAVVWPMKFYSGYGSGQTIKERNSSNKRADKPYLWRGATTN